MANLYIFAGLPGTGKSTLAQRLARRCKAVHLRIDTIEQGLRDLCNLQIEGEGYRLAYRIAADNLRLGIEVIADSCNPIELTRNEWERVAEDCQAQSINIEIICSDADEHRHRIESRKSTVPGFKLPTWNAVQSRQYEPWKQPRIVIDTAGRSAAESFTDLIHALHTGSTH